MWDRLKQAGDLFSSWYKIVVAVWGALTFITTVLFVILGEVQPVLGLSDRQMTIFVWVVLFLCCTAAFSLVGIGLAGLRFFLTPASPPASPEQAAVSRVPLIVAPRFADAIATVFRHQDTFAKFREGVKELDLAYTAYLKELASADDAPEIYAVSRAANELAGRKAQFVGAAQDLLAREPEVPSGRERFERHQIEMVPGEPDNLPARWQARYRTAFYEYENFRNLAPILTAEAANRYNSSRDLIREAARAQL